MTREEREDAIDIIQSILNKYEEDECLVTEITIGDGDIKAFRMAIEVLEQEPTTKENLAVDLIDRAELLKAMDTWDKFGYTARYGLERLDKDDKDFVAYVKYDDMVNCVNGMPSVAPSINNSSECIDKDLAVDCIDRNSIKYYSGTSGYMYASKGEIDKLPPVTPQEPRCRECKWWKDSDGTFRRGIGAESQCPINTHAVYSGEGYCYKFSPKVDMREVKE